jgi:ribonucleotide monophosphatase NagD (HAD superfamily)
MFYSDFSTDHYHTYLIDLSGVICNENGILSHAVQSIRRLQEKGRVFLLTNNTCDSPLAMSVWMKKHDIHIQPEVIISSGIALLKNSFCREHVYNKQVFVVGTHGSKVYVQEAGGVVVPHFSEAETVVIASSAGPKSDAIFSELIQQLRECPKPVICCNPDRYVRSEGGSLFPVAGYYAQRVETETNLPLFWIGKPTSSFSEVVKIVLTEHHIPIDKGICFFDDNPKNLCALQDDLGITGCWIKNTGIDFLFEAQIRDQTLKPILSLNRFEW